MKRTSISSTLLLIASLSYAQFTTRNIEPVIEKLKKIQYDSLSNIEYLEDNDYSKYIGQKILFYPRNQNSEINVNYYSNFFLLKPDTLWNEVPSEIIKKLKKRHKEEIDLKPYIVDKYKAQYINNKRVFENKYSGKDSLKNGYYTPNFEIEGKVFQILNIDYSQDYPTSHKFTLLSEKNDTLVWIVEKFVKYDAFPFIIVSYYENIKSHYVGNEYYIKDLSWSGKFIGTNLRNGNKNCLIKGKVKCVELSLTGSKDNFMTPLLIIEDSTANQFGIEICRVPDLVSYLLFGSYTSSSLFESHQSLTDPFVYEYKLRLDDLIEPKIINEEIRIKQERILSEEKLKKQNQEKLIKKYGNHTADLIMQGYVEIGMTKQMCEESWGEPKNINTTTGSFGTNEQWVYGSSYLYFENGILTTIQK